MDAFISLIITTIGLVMLISPLWILAFIQLSVNRLAIITAYVVVFLCFVSIAMVEKPSETLGAAAA